MGIRTFLHERSMKKTNRILLSVVIVPLAILFFILSLPLILASETKAAISLRAFRRRESGCVYLICASKRNWHDFLKNNVIPFLPDNVRVVWQKSVRGVKRPHIFAHLNRSGIGSLPKPYLVVVTPRALLHRSLNAPLQPLKVRPKKSSDIGEKCAQIIKELEKELRLPALPTAAQT
jgi:hypothetical protein